jgi:hypothetical protein
LKIMLALVDCNIPGSASQAETIQCPLAHHCQDRPFLRSCSSVRFQCRAVAR